MPVRIGQLEVIAAPRPPQRGEEGSESPPAPTAMDIVQMVDAEHRRRHRRSAD